MKKLVTIGLAVSLFFASSAVMAETTNNAQSVQMATQSFINHLSRHVYVIGEGQDSKTVERYEDPSFPLRPEVTVAIDGKIVEYGKYKPVTDVSGTAYIPLLQTLQAAGISYTTEGNYYVFTHNDVTYKVAFDGSRDMKIMMDGKIINTYDTGASEDDVMDNELYVETKVLQVIFFKADHLKDDEMVTVDQTVDGQNVRETMTRKEYNTRFNDVQYDTEAYSDRARVLNLYSQIDPVLDIAKANDALRKVMDTLPPEYFLEIRIPENEAQALKAKAIEITQGIADDYGKVKAIHQWVARTVAYDNDVYQNNFTYIKQKEAALTGASMAYRLLELPQGVCADYAELTNQLLKSIGIPSRFVAADAEHAWVDAYVGGRWISTDPTWDTDDAIINGVRINGYYKHRSMDNTDNFDFDISARYGLPRFVYINDEYGTDEDADSTVYANWYWDSPNSPNNGGGQTSKNPTHEISPNKFNAQNVGIQINGELVSVNPPARVINGSTLIPLRGVFEKLNSKVKWDRKAQTATVIHGDNTVKLKIGSKTGYVNGRVMTLAAPPFVSNEGSIYVPLRFVSETFGAAVSWDAAHWTAIINTAN